jgi:hypothetical protein
VGEPLISTSYRHCVPMSAADCTNSQSNKMYFMKTLILLLVMMNVALWQ